MDTKPSDPQVRNAVWQQLLDAERYSRYYGALSDRHRNCYRWLRFFLLFAAVGGIARFLDLFPASFAWISELSAIVIIALVIWEFMADYSTKAAILHTITIECGELQNDLDHLWLSLDQHSVGTPEVIDGLQRIDDAFTRLTARAGYAGVSQDTTLNQSVTEDAYKVIHDRYHLATEGFTNAE